MSIMGEIAYYGIRCCTNLGEVEEEEVQKYQRKVPGAGGQVEIMLGEINGGEG